MSTYEITVRQVGTGYMYIEAETPEGAIEKAERLIKRGTAQTILSYDGWDDEGVSGAVLRSDTLLKDEQMNLDENTEELGPLADITDTP